MKSMDEVKKAVREAITEALEQVGLEEFKKTSMFPLSNARLLRRTS